MKTELGQIFQNEQTLSEGAFQKNEIGKIYGILREKFNLFMPTKEVKQERKPLFSSNSQ
jgi:hypothetical protein